MRIVHSNSSGNPNAAQTGAAGAPRPIGKDAARSSGAKKTGHPADHVELSKVSGKVAEILGADRAARAAKVSRIAAAVKSGNYKVDPHAVAKSMVDQAITDGKESSGGGT